MAPLRYPSLQDPRDSDLVWSQGIEAAGTGSWSTRPAEEVTPYQRFPKPPESLTLWLSFISVPVSFKKRQVSRAEIDVFV